MELKNLKGHFMTITKHRMIVAKYCIRAGLIKQGLTHDLSKYSPEEFLTGVKYYQGDRSPNAVEREEYGYSKAWIHHKGRNKHHYEYWHDLGFDRTKGEVPVRMPVNYVVEMFFDRIAACKTYEGENYTEESPLKYYNKTKDVISIHPDTRKLLEVLLNMLYKRGEDKTIEFIRKRILKNA